MTDLEKFIELYKSFGIDCVVNKYPIFVEDEKVFHNCSVINLSDNYYENNENTISEKIVGYTGFYTDIIFDKSGKFIQQGIWE